VFLDIAVSNFTTTTKTLRGSAALSQHCSPPNHPTARRGCPSWHASFAGASSSARVLLQQQDARHPLTDYQANRLVDHHQPANFGAKSSWRARAEAAPRTRSPSGFWAAKIFLGYLSYIERRVGLGQPALRLPPPGCVRPQREAFGGVLLECEVLARRSLPSLRNEDDDVRVGHIFQPHVSASLFRTAAICDEPQL
jgi:hypothetical protein